MAKKSDGVLPEELIIEILLRLPVKTVRRCKCVCKSWLSLISNPDFATSHFQLAASPTTHGLVLETYSSDDPKALIVDFDASLNHDSSYAPLNPHFRPQVLCPGTEIRGSCRGFLFLITYADLYLWNPTTGVHKKIPAPKVRLYNHLFGFAYDHSTDDYLVVLGYCEDVPSNLEIFSLRANKWKQIEVTSHFPYLITTKYDDLGFLLNDTIHWVVFNYETSKEVIIAFDIKERKMSEIPLPYDGYPDHYGLSVLGGLICASILEMLTVKIWVMQNSSWTKILEFSIDPPVTLYSLSIVFITKCGDMIGTDGEGGLMKFNDKGQLLEHHSCRKGIDTERFIRSQMVVYTESLLSLPCGTEEA